jgi:hypothetical protein
VTNCLQETIVVISKSCACKLKTVFAPVCASLYKAKLLWVRKIWTSEPILPLTIIDAFSSAMEIPEIFPAG